MSLYSWLERQLFSLLPGYCPLCLGHPQHHLPWCEACWQALPVNRYACYLCAEPLLGELPNNSQRQSDSDNDGSPDACDTEGGCSQLLTPDSMLCRQCKDSPPMLHQCLTPYLYEREVARLMCRYKQHGDLLAGRLLFELTWYRLYQMNAFRALMNVGAILPVPADRHRTRERGFDPVHVWAQQLSKEMGIPLMKAFRQASVVSQKSLNRRDRRANMKGVFQLEAPVPCRVLLFDDVATTGATLESLAISCFEQGAEWVGALAVARTPARARGMG